MTSHHPVSLKPSCHLVRSSLGYLFSTPLELRQKNLPSHFVQSVNLCPRFCTASLKNFGWTVVRLPPTSRYHTQTPLSKNPSERSACPCTVPSPCLVGLSVRPCIIITGILGRSAAHVNVEWLRRPASTNGRANHPVNSRSGEGLRSLPFHCVALIWGLRHGIGGCHGTRFQCLLSVPA